MSEEFQLTIDVTEYSAMPEKDREAFATLVAAGGAVKIERVREGIQRPRAKLVVAKIGSAMIGCAALKSPADDYRVGLQKDKAQFPIPEEAYPHELGYVAVHTDHEGKGLGFKLCERVMLLAGEDGVFATTGTASMLTRILPSLGFRWVGAVWKGMPNQNDKKRPDLHLMIRPRRDRTKSFAVDRPNCSSGKG